MRRAAGLSTNWPGAEYNQAVEARENPPLFFRHALKLVNGGTISLGTCDSRALRTDHRCRKSRLHRERLQLHARELRHRHLCHQPATQPLPWWAIPSPCFRTPGTTSTPSPTPTIPAAAGPGNTTTYRTAIASGKGIEFVQIAGTSQDYGTDGGVHNYLRYLESWSGTLYYKGSLVNFFYSQQGIGVFKCCTTVYGPPTRGYTFDSGIPDAVVAPAANPNVARRERHRLHPGRKPDAIAASCVAPPAAIQTQPAKTTARSQRLPELPGAASISSKPKSAANPAFVAVGFSPASSPARTRATQRIFAATTRKK